MQHYQARSSSYLRGLPSYNGMQHYQARSSSYLRGLPSYNGMQHYQARSSSYLRGLPSYNGMQHYQARSVLSSLSPCNIGGTVVKMLDDTHTWQFHSPQFAKVYSSVNESQHCWECTCVPSRIVCTTVP